MKVIKDVHGSEAASHPLIIGKTKVYIHTNVRPVQIEDPITKDIYTDWVYDEKQYTLSEYEIFKMAVEKTKELMNKELDEGIFYEGKYYTITLEKQNLLASQLSAWMMNAQQGIHMPLTWNATGEACTEWSFDDLLKLSTAIAEHVAPIIKHQQDLEVEIRNANTVEEIWAVVENLD